jgi:hypothetical protein
VISSVCMWFLPSDDQSCGIQLFSGKLRLLPDRRELSVTICTLTVDVVGKASF